jgi:hypothetical protein
VDAVVRTDGPNESVVVVVERSAAGAGITRRAAVRPRKDFIAFMTSLHAGSSIASAERNRT